MTTKAQTGTAEVAPAAPAGPQVTAAKPVELRAVPPASPPAAAPAPATTPSFLPHAKTPIVTDLSALTILLYGKPKIGKSTLASQFPGALFLPTEPGLNHLSVHQAPADGSGVKDWPHFIAIMTEIARGGHPFKTIIVDTVDNLHKMCAEHVCRSRQVEYAGDMPHAKGWALVSNEFERVIRRVAQLPYGLILVSHATDRETETPKGTIIKTVPTLSEGARKSVAGLVDMILFCDVEAVPDADGVTRYRRVMRTKPATTFDAGDRTGTLPQTLDLSFGSFIDAWEAGQARKAAGG